MVLVASLVCFVLVAVATDPVAQWEAAGVDESTVAQRIEELDLDEPLPARYLAWLTDAARGDLGRSVSGETVRDRVGRALGVTVRMVSGAAAVGLVASVGAGLLAARFRRADVAATGVALVVVAMPAFWLAGVLIDVALRVNDLAGRQLFLVLATPERPVSYLLPILTLGAVAAAEWSRFFRADLLEATRAPHVTAARARGVPESVLLVRHTVRNALAGVTTASALSLGRLIGGAVVVEQVFAWRGMGSLLIDGISGADVNLVNGWLVIAATAIVVANLVADVVVARLDPRLDGG